MLLLPYFPARVLLLFFLIASATQSLAQQSVPALAINILHQPTPVVINDQSTVYYELQLVNRSNVSVEITSVQAIATTNGAVLFSASGEELNKRFGRTPFPTKLKPYDTSVVYLEFSLPDKAKSIQWLHSIHWRDEHKPSPGIGTEKGGTIGVTKQSPLVLGPPLRQGNWAAIYYADWMMGHRRMLYTVDGKQRIPGRFAIDLIRLDDKGHYAAANEDSIRNWYGYANEVLAVADATVATVKNDFTENSTISAHSFYPPDKATGNYISLDLGNNRFAFYEHLQPGSIKVKPGQRVRKGDVIAALGFTGQSTGPHLHFHVADANSPLGAEGIPFVFTSFQQLGHFPDMDKFGKIPWEPAAFTPAVQNQRPGPNSVIRFFP